MDEELSSQPKDDAYELRPGDLPPKWMVEREPLLLGLENNAAFRMFCFNARRRKKTVWLNMALMMFGVIAIMMLVERFLGYWGRSIFFLLSQSIILYSIIRRARGKEGLSALDVQFKPYARDLYLSGLTGRDLVVGYWGHRAASVRPALIRAFCALMALGCFALTLLATLPTPARWMVTVISIPMAHFMGSVSVHPWWSLFATLEFLPVVNGLSWRHKWSKTAAIPLALFSGLFLGMAVIVMVLLLPLLRRFDAMDSPLLFLFSPALWFLILVPIFFRMGRSRILALKPKTESAVHEAGIEMERYMETWTGEEVRS